MIFGNVVSVIFTMHADCVWRRCSNCKASNISKLFPFQDVNSEIDRISLGEYQNIIGRMLRSWERKDKPVTRATQKNKKHRSVKRVISRFVRPFVWLQCTQTYEHQPAPQLQIDQEKPSRRWNFDQWRFQWELQFEAPKWDHVSTLEPRWAFAILCYCTLQSQCKS